VFALTGCGHLSRSNAKTQLETIAKIHQENYPTGPNAIVTHVGIVSWSYFGQPTVAVYDPVGNDEAGAVLAILLMPEYVSK
jgi:hypothetical protein